MREMSGEQKEEMEEMVDVEPISSVATPTRVKEKSLGGKKVTAPQCQTKAAPVEPSCQCTPPKKGNQAYPIKGNRYNFPALEFSFSGGAHLFLFFQGKTDTFDMECYPGHPLGHYLQYPYLL